MLGRAKSMTTTEAASRGGLHSLAAITRLAHHADVGIILQHAPKAAPDKAHDRHQQYRDLSGMRHRDSSQCAARRRPVGKLHPAIQQVLLVRASIPAPSRLLFLSESHTLIFNFEYNTRG